MPAGITGSGGTTDVPGEMQSRSPVPRQPGTGVDGGLNDGPAAGAEAASKKMGAGPASGTPNLTSGNAVGQR